ncbi:MAG: GtrA family protein [Devosia sp.]|uniref:GtrA family protein n=1 Tax=Devosia sp. TaxID=1871048 RepID=UPI0019EA15C9|nr:GtrA family protein [Devosia sp.]MBF0680371.1 GtrA family protein [Devosia sp.]
MKLGRSDIVPFLKFGTIGALNTFLHSGVVIVLHGKLGLPVLPAHTVAFLLVNLFSYLLNSFLVFRAAPTLAQYVRFFGVSLFSLVATLVIAGICELLGLDYRIGLVAVILITPPVTYALQKAFTFRMR